MLSIFQIVLFVTCRQQCELWERCFEEEIKRKLFDSVADEWRVEFVKKEPADRAGWEGGRKGLKKVNGEVAFKCPFEVF